MWSGTECGTQCGNSGFVRTHAIQPGCNVRHGTGYVRTMWGSCAAQYSLSYIEYCHPTPTHVTYDGVGALYAFPLHAKQGDIFFVLPRPIRQDSIIGSYTCGQFLFYKISAHQPLISDASSCGTYTPPDECSDPGTDRVSLGWGWSLKWPIVLGYLFRVALEGSLASLSACSAGSNDTSMRSLVSDGDL